METVHEEEEEKLGQNQPHKRIKFVEEEKDRISALPDCLLVEILSRLHETKYAIRRHKLSKRWRYVWASVPNLTFKYDDDIPYYERNTKYAPPISSFFSYVDQTLTRRGHSKLKKFELNTRYQTRFQIQMNSIIRYVINCNVEDLTIRLWNRHYFDLEGGEFTFDQFFFNNSCITDLTLGGCSFNHDGAISWKTLRSLYIKHGKLNEDLIEIISSGSPVLETLKLEWCFGYERIDITSKSVKNFVISGYKVPKYGEHDHLTDTLEINAPSILSLVIDYEPLALNKILLLDVSSLVIVDLNYIFEKHYGYYKEQILNPDVIIGMCCYGVKYLLF